MLERTVADRRAAADTEASYTARLLAEPSFAGEKVREEAEEVTRAVREESDERVREEAADVLYHLDVLLAARGISLSEAFEVLNARRRQAPRRWNTCANVRSRIFTSSQSDQLARYR